MTSIASSFDKRSPLEHGANPFFRVPGAEAHSITYLSAVSAQFEAASLSLGIFPALVLPARIGKACFFASERDSEQN
jgi:hypothetical protein